MGLWARSGMLAIFLYGAAGYYEYGFCISEKPRSRCGRDHADSSGSWLGAPDRQSGFSGAQSMAVGLGFEGEDPKLLFARTFVFAFLLLASPQICEIGLSMTSKIIELLQIPDAVNVTFVDESVFGAIGAAWLLVIIFGIIVMFKVFKLLLEIAERYVILAMLTITAPLAFAMGGSKSTSEIFTGRCRMFGSMCLLMVTNVIFFKMLLSVLATVPSGFRCSPVDRADPYRLSRSARKATAIVTRIG